MKVLVAGASGLVGRHLIRHLAAARVDVFGASRSKKGDLPLDLARPEILVDRLPPGVTHAVVCCGLTAIDECARDPVGSSNVNVAQTLALIRALVAHGVAPVFCSSDLVFSGDRGRYHEQDVCTPTTEYGRQKLAVERALAAEAPLSLVCRFSKLYCLDSNDRSPVGQILNALDEGRSVYAADDQIICPTRVGDTAAALLALMRAGATGVWHVASQDRMTRFDLAMMLAAAVGRPDLVERRSINDFRFVEPRPKDVSLDASRAVERFGLHMTSLVDNLPEIIRRRTGTSST